MEIRKTVAMVAASIALLAAAGPALAQPAFEIGSSLGGVLVGLGNDNDGTSVGIPAPGFGLFEPAVYGSIFAGERLAFEPRIGFLYVTSDGESDHILNLGGQVSLFLSGSSRPSLYVFGAAGVMDSSGGGRTPKSVAGGIGYRIPVGEHLAFRLDGRYLHATEEGGNQLVFGFTIGGVVPR